ncbi:MAG: hypothetical protein A2V85_06495 [Chloroflexi bacterium RBG_16_72_14]|nr:MAG: hypothetical protein A2V85_06495 [Chloroflexi bacterium RBG_16_72_14]
MFLNGDSAWSIVVSELPEAWDAYFADRASKGINAVIINAVEALFTADPPRTVDGIEPFLRPGDLATPNPAYWARVDGVIDAAARHGMQVLLAPLYLGFLDPHYPGFGFTSREEGWHAVVAGADEDRCREYGRFLGKRYRDRQNIIWVIGGDRNPGPLRDRMRAFVAGILEIDDRHLMTAHVHPDSSPVDEYEGDGWLTLNQTYSYRIVHRKLLEDYGREPVRPFILFESTYEGEHDASELQIRRQAWWALTCGATGQFFGNFPVWLMAPGWQAALDSPGARALSHLAAFVGEVEWWRLEPDIRRRLLVAGLGEANGLDRATAAIAPDGSSAVIYVPTPRMLTINLEALAGWTSVLRWFDPVDGSWTGAELVTRRGMRQVRTPFDHDAVLLLEDPARGDHGTWPRPSRARGLAE